MGTCGERASRARQSSFSVPLKAVWALLTTEGCISAACARHQIRLCNQAHCGTAIKTASSNRSRAAVPHAAWPQPPPARLELAARGVVQHAAVVGDLVEGQQQEAHVHALNNGAQAGHGGTHTCRSIFGCSEVRLGAQSQAAGPCRGQQLRHNSHGGQQEVGPPRISGSILAGSSC